MASKDKKPINSTAQSMPASFGPNIVSYTSEGAKKGASSMTNPLPQKGKVKGKN
jgi:hypothetical protein